MKKIGLLFGFCVFAFIGYQIVKRTTPAQIELSSESPKLNLPKNLLQGSKEFLDFVQNPQGLTAQNCASTLTAIYDDVSQIDPYYFDAQDLAKNYREVIRNLFQARAQLRQRLKGFVETKEITPAIQESSCITAIRNVNRAARYIEDYLGETFLQVKPFDEKTDPVFYGTFTGEEPWLEKVDSSSQIGIRSGDVIASRGNAATSAAIAKIGVVDSQFSHVAFVYIKGDSSGRIYSLEEAIKNPNVLIMEAHIELGSTIRPLKTYLEDGNARNVQFRYPDAQLAHQAAKASYDFVTAHNASEYEKFRRNPLSKLNPAHWAMKANHPDFNVPYDFKMDLSNTTEVFCSEIASLGYSQVGVKMPLFFTTITPAAENDLVRTMEITTQRVFAPGDMELDTRFDMLAEWRDYRKVKGLRNKDAILVGMYDWMKKYRYKFYPSEIVKIGAEGYWLARWLDIPAIKIGGKVVVDFTATLPKNMTPQIAAMVTTLNRTADVLQARLVATEAKYSKNHAGLLLPLKDMLLDLENYRGEDLSVYKGPSKKNSAFHAMFRSDLLEGAN